jgi:hypothetical protein
MSLNLNEYGAYLQTLAETKPATEVKVVKQLRLLKPKKLTRKQFSKTKNYSHAIP